jgi:predicted esterase
MIKINRGDVLRKKYQHFNTAASAIAAGLLCILLIAGGLFAQSVTPADWVLPELKIKYMMSPTPKTATDIQIATLITTYQDQIDALNWNNTVVKKHLPQVQENVFILYREYNENHTRAGYESPDFSVSECLGALQEDMSFYMPQLAAGSDPSLLLSGKWMQKVYWLTDHQGLINIMGKYDLRVCNNYTPFTPHPLIVSTQDNPSDDVVKTRGFIMARSIKKGYQNNDTKEQFKNWCIIKDVAQDVHIDPFKIFATGFSKGGHQSLKLGFRYQDWFAGLIPVHNDFKQEYEYWAYASNLLNISTFLIHSASDGYYKPELVVMMSDSGCPVKEYLDGLGHTADWAFRDPAGLDSICSFIDTVTMDPYPKTVRHSLEHPRYSRAYWTNVRIADAGFTPVEYLVQAQQNNLIEVTATTGADNITRMDFYLTSALVNMSQPVIVTFNGDTVYNDMPSSETSVTIKSGNQSYSGVKTLLWQYLDSLRHVRFDYVTSVHPGTQTSGISGLSGISVVPNPFSLNALIAMQNTECKLQNAKLTIYDMTGKRIRATSDVRRATYIWDGRDNSGRIMPAGNYLVRVKAGNRIVTKSLIKIK